MPVHIYTGQLFQQFLVTLQSVMLHITPSQQLWVVCGSDVYSLRASHVHTYIIVATVTVIIQLKSF